METFSFPGVTSRDEYFRQKAIDHQKCVVNFKTSATRTSEALVWTYRTTNCDVISVITTSALIRDGKMKDIRIQPMDVKRLKPPTVKASNKDLLGSSPYDFGLSVDIVKKTKKINKMLHEEKKDFMAKLNITRFVRSKLENDAATKLQSIYRGYNTRKNLGEISHFLDINHMIRANLRSYLDSSNYSTLTLGQYTRERQVVRNCAATLIQCAFRMFLSRKYLRRRKCEQNLRRKVHAAVVIQARARGISARARVKVLIEKRRIILYRLSVIKIQSALRGMFSRRRVYRRRYRLQFLAARMIQSWYRAKYSRKMTNHIKSVMHFRQSNKGAMLMQTVVRRFLSIRRVNRIRLRKFHVLISSWVIRMQCLARKFLAKVTLRKKKQLVQQKVVEEQLKRATELRKEQQAKIDEESKSLLEGADIFVQAEKGNTVGVEDIFKGLMGGVHTVHDVNAQGDNLITISAKVGNSDLLRKCIMWGFNINHRNMDGHLAIALAAKNNHLPAFQYLFSFYNSAENATEKQVLQLTEEDIGFLLVSAAANCAIADMTMLQALIAQGVDVNTPSVNGMTAIHAACEIGHIEAFKLLLKNKAKPEGVDETGQSPLHKACSSSLQLVQWILGLDPEFSTYMAESTRYASVVTVDADGKDCVLHAALAGQTEVVELLDSIIQNGGGLQSSSQSGKRKGGGGEEDNHEEISWSAQDITKAVNLVSTGNVFCLHRILDAGFDADWQDVDTGLSMSLASCKRGDTDIIDQLLEKGADFSLVDQLGRNCMHYAAMAGENSSSLAVFLITHPAAAKCKLSKSLLLAKDQTGDTPFHIAAREGSEINVDLLASDIFPAVLNVRNEDGMTPLLLACRYYREKLIHVYLKLGADALAVDNHDRGCMWHLFHPEASILNVRRPLCSEFVIITLQGSNASFNRKEKDEEVAKLAAEISTVVALLKAGCTLYTDYGGTPEDVLRLPYKSFVPPTAPHDPDSEPGDVILQELSMGLIKAIVPSVVSPLDAWRLFISSIRFDDGSMKMMQHLLRMGLLDVIAADHEASDESTIASVAQAFAKAPEAVPAVVPAKRAARASIAPTLGSRAVSTSVLDTYQISRLNDVFFLDMNAVAWVISLKSTRALTHFLKKGYDVTIPVDTVGNSCLHFVAANGSADMVDIVAADKRVRYEMPNPLGQTAGMLAAKAGNFKVAKRLFELKASPRKSLEGKYAAWVLAFARKYEKNEKNLQTGRYGDDDERFFPTDPDPFYSTWYMG